MQLLLPLTHHHKRTCSRNEGLQQPQTPNVAPLLYSTLLPQREEESGLQGCDMGESSNAPAASMAATGEERWRQLDSSVNAVSFGFVATAVLILMFLVMAIFERFLRSSSPRDSHHPQRYPHHHTTPAGKLHGHPSSKTSIYASGVSVLMPGRAVPSHIAHPAPLPCDPERIPWPSHVTLHIGDSSSIAT